MNEINSKKEIYIKVEENEENKTGRRNTWQKRTEKHNKMKRKEKKSRLMKRRHAQNSGH